MEYRRLGQTGLEISTIGLGTNNFGGRMDYDATKKVLNQTMEEGINFIDCANTYGGGKSEEFIGKALGKNRQEMIIATKAGAGLGPPGPPITGPNQRGATRHHIIQQAELSLKRLDTDYIDLFYMHRWDADTPIEETMRALDDLVHSGKVRYLGCSNYTAWQMVEAIWAARANNLYNYCCIQNEYSLVSRDVEREVAPVSERYGVSVIPVLPAGQRLPDGQVRAGRGAARGHAVCELAEHGQPLSDGGKLEPAWQAAEFFGGARALRRGAGLRVAAGQPGGAERDRGGDEAGAGDGQREGGRVAALGGGDGRDTGNALGRTRLGWTHEQWLRERLSPTR